MDLTLIGYLSKTHGVKGQLILKSEKIFFYENVKVIFIDTSTGLAPYFVKKITENNNGFIVELEEIDVIEKAKLLLGKQVHINSDLIDEQKAEFDWLGYEIIDKSYGLLGLVFSTSNNGYQVLLSIKYKDKEVILPLVDDFIEKIDEDKKQLYFNAPDGLIDLYLNDI